MDGYANVAIKPKYLKSPSVGLHVDEMAERVIEKCESKKGFKKRPNDGTFMANSSLLCRAIAANEGCSYADDMCKFSHDKEDFEKRRLKDLDVFQGPCPVYQSLGYCRFGRNCRLGDTHTDENKLNFKLDPALVQGPVERNVLSQELKLKLRKNMYPLLTLEQRKNKKSKVEVNEEHVSKMNLPEVKKIDFKGKVYVAPLTTVGNLPFRRIMKDFKTDITCGEMAVSTNIMQGQPREWALLNRHACEDVFGVQIAAAHGDQVARCTELLAKETDVDFIDINMGCPIDLVCKTGAGSALMQRPKKLEQVVKAALTGIEVGSLGKTKMPALTVKMRTGWNHANPNAHELVPLIQTYRGNRNYLNDKAKLIYDVQQVNSVAALTIHGRSRLMRYTKYADWDYIGKAADARDVNAAHMAMIGGGDILNYTEFDEHLKSGQLDTCMIARGAMIKPWLPTEIKEKRHWDISSSERLDILKSFVYYGLEHWGSDQRGVNTTRRYLLEWLSFLCRYVPIGLLEKMPVKMNDRPPAFVGRDEMETLMGSTSAVDWIRLTEILLGPVPENFKFTPKHKANAY